MRASDQPGILREGAGRVWRYQRLVWWMFLGNLVLGYFSAVPLAARLGAVLGHSSEMQKLGDKFDWGAFLELTTNPNVDFWSGTTSSMLLAVLFALFVLFLTGGALEAYWTGRRLPTEDFFRACGTYFWRWVRLLICMAIFMIPVMALGAGVSSWSGKLSDDAGPQKLGFWVGLAGFLAVTLLMMVLRLWFDMAQVWTVAENERATRRALARAARLMWGKFPSLFWLSLRTSLSAWLGLTLGLWFWTHLPGGQTWMTLILFETVLWWWIGTRLWQRASECVWYERYAGASAGQSAEPPLPARDVTFPLIQDESYIP